MGYLILLVGGRGGWWRGRTVAGRGKEGIEGEEREGREKMNKKKKTYHGEIAVGRVDRKKGFNLKNFGKLRL